MNTDGLSTISEPSAPVQPGVIVTPPWQATDVTAIAGDRSAQVSWQAPEWDGGLGIYGYVVTAEPGGASVTTSDTSALVDGLTNGTLYTFTVRVLAGGGESVSAPSPPVMPVG